MNFRLFLLLVFGIFLAACVFAADCGNGSCEGPSENQCSCPADCGECSGDYTGSGTCKELACVSNVCTVIPKSGCCGNEICESSENYSNCPADCLPESIDITVVYPGENDYFLFGEAANILVEVLVDNSTKAVGATVSTSGIFKTMPLYNDGKHGDGTAFDAVYGNYFTVTEDMLGTSTMNFTATFRGLTGEASASLVVRPDLNVALNLPAEVALGDVLDLRGKVMAKANPVGLPLDANVFFQGTSVFSRAIISDPSTGEFFFSYPVSLLSKLGIYTLSVTGTDANGNKAVFEQGFEVKEKVFAKGLKISILPFSKTSFARGEEIPLIVELFDDSNNSVDKAVVFVTAFGEKISMYEFDIGKYSASIVVPFSAVEGENFFEVGASKQFGSALAKAYDSFTLGVEKTTPIIKLIKPEATEFKAGDTIEFEVLISYPNNEKVINAEVFVLIGMEEIKLFQTEPGRFTGGYFLAVESYGLGLFSVKIVDEYGNVNSIEKEINVSGETFQFFLMRNIIWVIVIVVIIAVVLFVASKFGFEASAKSAKKKQTSGLESKLEQLQVNYFKKGIISRPQYDRESKKLKQQIRKFKERKIK